MQNEFKVGGEKVEVTVAKNDEIWSLGEYSGRIVGDGRILITAADGQARFAHSAKVGDTWWVHFDGHTFCIEKTEPGSTDNDSDGGDEWSDSSSIEAAFEAARIYSQVG